MAADFASLDLERLELVGDDLDDAISKLRHPWVAPVRLIPWVGRQLNATEQIAVAGREVVDAGEQALEALETASLDDPVDALNEVSDELGSTTDRLRSIGVPSGKWLVGPVAAARQDLVENLLDATDEIARYEALVSGLSQLVSGNTHYVVAAANTSEMGSASGMLLQVGTMRIDDGQVLISDFRSVEELGRPSLVPIDDDIRLMWGSLDPGHLWQYTSHISSRASEVSRVTADMWLSDQGERMDGVLIISPVAMQILLEAAGVETVDVAGVQLPVIAVTEFFALTQYEEVFDGQGERRESIAPVASAAVRALLDSEIEPRVLAAALIEAIDGRHLTLWSRDPAQQQRWQTALAAGDPPQDSVKVAVLNAGGNKLDRFLNVQANITTSAAAAGGSVVRIDVGLTNTATADLPSYVQGANAPGSYLGHVVVNIPNFAANVVAGGDRQLNASAPDGQTHSYAFIIELDPGATANYFVEFEVPEQVDSLQIEPSGRFPAISWVVDGTPRLDRRGDFRLG